MKRPFPYDKLMTVMEWYQGGHFPGDQAYGAFELARQQGLDGAGKSVQEWMGLTEHEYSEFMHDRLPPRRGTYQVYFIQDSISGMIEIGASVDPKARLAMLQTGCPGELRIVKTATDLDEREYHQRFAEYRVRGEWFKCEGELDVFIKGNK